MGAHPYWYVVPYRADINAALQELRAQEFQAGRYNPVLRRIEFPIGPHSPAPGPRHTSIEAACRDSGADGTRSILDLVDVAEEPAFRAVAPLPDETLLELYGTTRPTREMVEAVDDFWEDMERGEGVYLILYKEDQPDEIYFAGYSYD